MVAPRVTTSRCCQHALWGFHYTTQGTGGHVGGSSVTSLLLAGPGVMIG
jgi:hypothetical protein